jgi:hypothetical protein
MNRLALIGTSVALVLASSAHALAQTSSGHTSGSAVGGNVTPSAVVQKGFEGRSGFADALDWNASAIAAGAPGVAGKRGAQSGGAPRGRGAESNFVY